MTITVAFILWLLMLAIVVAHMVPVAWKWGKLLVWVGLALLSLVMVLMHAVTFR